MSKVTATYLTSNAMDWIHLDPQGIAFQVTPELLRAYLAPDVDWGDWDAIDAALDGHDPGTPGRSLSSRYDVADRPRGVG